MPDDDKGAGEAVETAKKAPAKRKKDEDGEEKPKRGRAKKAKVSPAPPADEFNVDV